MAVREWRLQLSRDSVYSESGGPPKGNCGEGNAAGNSVDAGCLKEASFRRNCWEGNRPQSLEVASLLKLVAGDVLFPISHQLSDLTFQFVFSYGVPRVVKPCCVV